MRFLRQFIHAHRGFALALVALALCMKAVVPSGFMVAGHPTGLVITICGQGQGLDHATHILVPLPGKGPDSHGEPGHPTNACPYAGLGMAALTGADAPLLALALAFLLALGFLPIVYPSTAARNYLRPPLRGPPAPG